MKDFINNYKVEKETEKSVYISINWWLETSNDKSTNQTIKFNMWVPKSVIKENGIPNWIILKAIQETENKQHSSQNNSLYNQRRRERLGEETPLKIKIQYLMDGYSNILNQNIKIGGLIIELYPDFKTELVPGYCGFNADGSIERFDLVVFFDNYPEVLTNNKINSEYQILKNMQPLKIKKYKYENN